MHKSRAWLGFQMKQILHLLSANINYEDTHKTCQRRWLWISCVIPLFTNGNSIYISNTFSMRQFSNSTCLEKRWKWHILISLFLLEMMVIVPSGLSTVGIEKLTHSWVCIFIISPGSQKNCQIWYLYKNLIPYTGLPSIH